MGGHPVGAVYPRVCGGSLRRWKPSGRNAGLSPRVRGKRATTIAQTIELRSIPACAGEAVTGRPRYPRPWVYPRVCGGSRTRCDVIAVQRGLSPRVRGKQPGQQKAGHQRRSIPACAGEARAGLRHTAGRGVYPRVCGGSVPPPAAGWSSKGLSPRVRGKRRVVCNQGGRHRSIPACAGEALKARTLDEAITVYPRVCGGS